MKRKNQNRKTRNFKSDKEMDKFLEIIMPYITLQDFVTEAIQKHEWWRKFKKETLSGELEQQLK